MIVLLSGQVEKEFRYKCTELSLDMRSGILALNCVGFMNASPSVVSGSVVSGLLRLTYPSNCGPHLVHKFSFFLKQNYI